MHQPGSVQIQCAQRLHKAFVHNNPKYRFLYIIYVIYSAMEEFYDVNVRI
jgi:hypothetical protein